MAAAIYFGDTDLSTIGCWVDGTPPWWSAPSRQYAVVAIPGRMGGAVSGDPTTGPRRLVVPLVIDPPLRTLAQRASLEDQLKELAFRGLVPITVDDTVTAPRRINGVCESVEITPVTHPFLTQVARASVTFTCPDPTWEDVTGQVIGFSSTASEIPLGTAPSGGIVRIAAPPWSANVVTPVLHYLSAGGVTVGSLTFSVTLTAGTGYLEIDLDRLTASTVASGTSSNAITSLSAGDFFGLDPMDGDRGQSSYPMLKVTATSGTPSGTWLGSKRWL